jgi:hypothetical protein
VKESILGKANSAAVQTQDVAADAQRQSKQWSFQNRVNRIG